MAREADLTHLRAVLGADGANRLIAAFGGTTLYVSAHGGGADWAALALTLGEPAALRYAAAFGSAPNYIPRNSRVDPRHVRAAVRRLTAAGESTRRAVTAAAREHQISDRYVWSLLAEADAAPANQIDLFTTTR